MSIPLVPTDNVPEFRHRYILAETLNEVLRNINTITYRDGNLIITGLPTADPGVSGALWVDTGAGRVLKVSA